MDSLEEIRELADGGYRPYPMDAFEHCAHALFLFGAGWLGANDAYRAYQAGVRATIVDTDEEKLEAMRRLYPPEWEFVCDDAFKYAEWNSWVRRWDLVSVDPWNEQLPEALENLELWTTLAQKVATVFVMTEGPHPEPPPGWKSNLFDRTAGISWLVLRRDTG